MPYHEDEYGILRDEYGYEVLEERAAEELWVDLLCDIHEPVTLGGVEYLYADVWKSTDPIAYECAKQEWLDQMETVIA